MASPAGAELQNGISTPPATTTTTTAPHPSPPTQPSTQPTHAPNPTTTTTTTIPAQPPPHPTMHASFPSTSLLDPGTSKRPRDARLIHLILANMGVNAYTERVPLQLLDCAYRYTSSILTDAISYEPPTTSSSGGGGGAGAKKRSGADKATEEEGGQGGVSLNALRTAVGARAATQFSAVLGKEFMSEVASERNRVALPRVEREFGIRLPPERYCFTGVGWGMKEAWEDGEESGDEEMETEMEEGQEEAGDAMGFGGPVGGEADTAMGGMEDQEELDEDEFDAVMGDGSAAQPSG